MPRTDTSQALYVISVAAQLAGVHPQTLRIYERRGLIRPERTPGGSRRYSDDDIRRLRRIQALTAEGMSLTGVEHVMTLEGRLRNAQAEAARLRRQLDDLETEHRQAVREVHRQYRRDLLPVRQTDIELFRRR
jgi:MerR family transcriptional regulator/heat shock protein HspR